MPVRVATNIILRINKVLRKQDSEHASHIKPRLLKKKKKKALSTEYLEMENTR